MSFGFPETDSDSSRGLAAESVTGVVFNIMRFSVRDGPGLRTTVFLKGCPLRCRWCHNPESQSPSVQVVFRKSRCVLCGDCVEACPERALSVSGGELKRSLHLCRTCGACVRICSTQAQEKIGEIMSVAEVMAEVRKDLSFYEESGGGVTFSGGEPLQQPEFLGSLLQASREEEIHTTLDTSGAASWDVIDGIRQNVDLFLYDLKIFDGDRHRMETGVTNELVLDNLARLAGHGHGIVIRLPVIPGINDDVENIIGIGTFLASLPEVRKVQILPYHQAGEGKYVLLNRGDDISRFKTPEGEKLDEVEEILRRFDLEISR